jgi:hypothetical protein
MSPTNTPKDGDFAAELDRLAQAATNPGTPLDAAAASPQTLEDVLVGGQEPTDEFLADLAALDGAPELSDEELARQALAHPGGDGNTSTPE